MLSKEARIELGILKHGDSDSARLGKVVAEVVVEMEKKEKKVVDLIATFAEKWEGRIQALEQDKTTNAVGSNHGN